jgi:DNA-binding NarL/FixJ family response regulator
MTTGAAARIRVFAVDDHAVVRVGLRAFLDVVPDVELVGDAPDARSALAQLQRMAEDGHSPDVVLMDLVLRGMCGIEAIAEIRRRFPTVEVIVVTGFGEVHRVQAALGAGAAGYVLKDADVDEIVLAIRAAHRGQVHLDRDVTLTLTQALVAPQRTSVALTAREREVMVHVARGRSNREISRVLSIGERTVQTHLGNVLAKLGLHSRTQAALWAVREGLVEL